MSPSDIITHAQAQDDEPDVDGPDGDDPGEGEVDRSQSEAKDDAALLVSFFSSGLLYKGITY